MGNFFYTKCMQALAGESDYILVFIPWFWQEEYYREPPRDFIMSSEELKIVELYKLSAGQVAWRRHKIAEFNTDRSNGEWKFKQEYPCTPIEAFQTSGSSLISQENIMRARRSEIIDPGAPLILGVDPGRNKDRSVLLWRRGREVPKYKIYTAKETGGSDSQWEMRLAGIIANLIETEALDKVFIDVTKSYGTLDRLHELGYSKIVAGVLFSEHAMENDIYLNKRVEIWMNMQTWFDKEVNIPDEDVIQRDLAAMPDVIETSSGVCKLESKDKIIKACGFSPDIGDALAVTFAYPVRSKRRDAALGEARQSGKKKHVLKTLQRTRR